ncbi:MAG: hypothetical protein HFH72_08600 [Lachnospiraceae bacterium]|nr:hypothetical protein [Lachnospiraceae bacterium]
MENKTKVKIKVRWFGYKNGEEDFYTKQKTTFIEFKTYSSAMIEVDKVAEEMMKSEPGFKNIEKVSFDVV